MRLVYSLLLTVLLPLLLLRMLWRSRRAPDYRRRLGERMGFFTLPADQRPLLWVHAVSLGETLAARPLIERMLGELPTYRILITSTTPTGSAQVSRLFGSRVEHVYVPWDTPGAVRRFLARTRPQLLLIMETELWPNMLHYCARQGCRVLLANARLSARSARGYARFSGATRDMLNNISWIAAQSGADAERFVALGMAPSRVTVTGSVKYDVEITPPMRARAAELRMLWGLAERPCIVAASTHDGEDTIILEAFAALLTAHPGLLLLLAPRHPERFDRVYELCLAAGMRVQRRSRNRSPGADCQVLLIDTLGELLQLFGVADLAVIGGSFVDRGGHNPLEATAWGKPVLSGESRYNFADISQQLIDAGAMETVADGPGLQQRLHELLSDADERKRRRDAALAVMRANRGALDAQMKLLTSLLAAH